MITEELEGLEEQKEKEGDLEEKKREEEKKRKRGGGWVRVWRGEEMLILETANDVAKTGKPNTKEWN